MDLRQLSQHESSCYKSRKIANEGHNDDTRTAVAMVVRMEQVSHNHRKKCKMPQVTNSQI